MPTKPVRPKRKVIQIAQIPVEHEYPACYRDLGALCDDGTMWRLKDDIWKRIPGVPQD